MTRTLHIWTWAAVAGAGILAVAFGPLFAGYALAIGALGVVLVLMGMQFGHTVDDWHLNHRFHHAHPRTGAHGRRHAA